MIWPLVRPAARPIAKMLIKRGLIAYRETEQLYTGAVRGIGEMARRSSARPDH